MVDFLALFVGLGLTWAFGAALIGALYRVAQPGDVIPGAWLVGCGWFVGAFATTLVMRALSSTGIAFGVASVGMPVLVLTLAAAWIAIRGRGPETWLAMRRFFGALPGGGLQGWQRTVWIVVVAWLALRFALLFAEVWWRPLYPWDAWTQWGTKARVWFEMRSMVPFASAGEWFAAPPEARLWYDAAPHYPGTMPLLQVWSALLVGRWDDALANLPWWVTGVAFTVALYGGLLLLGFRRLPALLGATVVLTLPIVNVHVALAGYADLPIACYLTLGTIAGVQAIRTRGVATAVLAVVLLAAMVLVKNPGKAWLLTLVPTFIAAALPRYGVRIAAAVLGLSIFALLVVTRLGVTILGYQFTNKFALPWDALFDAYFSFANWNLLWYAALAALVIGRRQLFSADVAPYTLAVASGLLFLFIGFAFTNAGAWVEDQSTTNRATLHVAPLVVVWMLVVAQAWFRNARPPSQTVAPET